MKKIVQTERRRMYSFHVFPFTVVFRYLEEKFLILQQWAGQEDIQSNFRLQNEH